METGGVKRKKGEKQNVRKHQNFHQGEDAENRTPSSRYMLLRIAPRRKRQGSISRQCMKTER